ncbi:hypothetical protein NMY22_g16167 [Coprinellus aureogranulatus]|nr:hypothetical protein NMY22_g16167 [Coprinellus aureogranulatus]
MDESASAALASSLARVVEGHVDFHVASINRTCQTYYKIIGTLHPGVRPLIALHGGPGVNSEYLEIISDVTNGRPGPLIVYDQIGNGLSTHLPETAGNTSFWTVDLFIDDLKNLLHKLNIKEYDLLGQSWGGMLASSFAIQQPRGLKHLVLFSSPASMDLWIQAQNDLKAKFPQKLQDALDKYDEDGVDTPEYQEAMIYYNSHHLCTLDPMPEPIVHGSEWGAKDPTVGNTMYGPYQFRVTGSLEEWSVIDQLWKIKAPTLVINGKEDGAQDIAVLPFVRKIPEVMWVKFMNSSHMAHFEEREKFMRTLSRFLY